MVSKIIKNAAHIVGLICLGIVLFLQILTTADMLLKGYSIIVERDPLILAGRNIVIAIAVTYFFYLFQKFIKSARTIGIYKPKEFTEALHSGDANSS